MTSVVAEGDRVVGDAWMVKVRSTTTVTQSIRAQYCVLVCVSMVVFSLSLCGFIFLFGRLWFSMQAWFGCSPGFWPNS